MGLRASRATHPPRDEAWYADVAVHTRHMRSFQRVRAGSL